VPARNYVDLVGFENVSTELATFAASAATAIDDPRGRGS
jgi:hypothetical protein